MKIPPWILSVVFAALVAQQSWIYLSLVELKTGLATLRVELRAAYPHVAKLP